MPKNSLTFPPERLLLAPGPTNLHSRVLQALIAPILGHKDPRFLDIMDETAALLRYVFQTRNKVTLALPGTGGAGMEATLVNLLEPGDTVVVLDAGYFAARMVEIADRCRARVIVHQTEWGRAVDIDSLEAALQQAGRVKLVAAVHGETSTGVEHPIAEIARVAHAHGALLAVDAVPTLGGVWLPVDEWQIDICYSGSQKCLSAPPGLAPITVSEPAMQVIHQRKTKVQSWYHDLSILSRYWSRERVYHHTAPINMTYALREALVLIQEEGLETVIQRIGVLSAGVLAGLQAMGLELFSDPAHRLTTVVAVKTPTGIDEARVRATLLETFNIEISGGLGAYAGKLWRIGIMGHSARPRNLLAFLAALEMVLREQGHATEPGVGPRVACEVFSRT
ncbi:MAG: alanine--glyoxylate aminotransferase family protein [Acidobacteria bacterium]|nr:alanine--glyoxylate aminotransferase family protein [Acidobacteriota bacterium]MBI3657246.1 alanine--glyoxylate aminotransferase family protein [Acidobacteriota bacterium]